MINVEELPRLEYYRDITVFASRHIVMRIARDIALPPFSLSILSDGVYPFSRGGEPPPPPQIIGYSRESESEGMGKKDGNL